MNRGMKAWQLPPRLITGAYFLNAGLSKRGADDATAGQLHGVAGGTYAVLWQPEPHTVPRPALHRGDRHRGGLGAAGGPGLAGRRWADRLRPGHPRLIPADPRHAAGRLASSHPAGHPSGQGRLDGWHRARPHDRRARGTRKPILISRRPNTAHSAKARVRSKRSGKCADIPFDVFHAVLPEVTT